MRKLITLLAAVTLAASSFAVAETTTGNPNDPLQQIEPNGSEPAAAPTTLADADTSAPAAASTDTGSPDTTAPVKKKHYKKHPKHHCKTHHHKKKPSTSASDTPPATEPATSAPAAQ